MIIETINEPSGFSQAVQAMRKEIYNHPGFFCCTDGTIIGKRNKPLIGHIDRCGYKEVLLSENGKTNQARVHRLILETFKPRADMKNLDVNHINGIKTDNRLENLEWCTRSENILHAYQTGLERKMTGYNHWRHSLTKEQVKDIKNNCKPHKKGYTVKSFAEKYNCSEDTIRRCLRGETYNDN